MYPINYSFGHQIRAGIPKANPATTAPIPAVARAPPAVDPSVGVTPLPEACDAADGVEVVAKTTVFEPDTEVTVLVAIVPVVFPLEVLAALKSRPQSAIRDATSVRHSCQPSPRIEVRKYLVSGCSSHDDSRVCTVVIVCRESILLGTCGARVEHGFSIRVTAHAVVERRITIYAVFASGREVDQASAVGNTRLRNVVLVDVLSSH